MPLPAEHVQQLAGLAQACTATTTLLQNPRFVPALNDLLDTPQGRLLAASAPGKYLLSKGITEAGGLRGTYSQTVSANGDAASSATTREQLFNICRSIAWTVDDKTNFVTICFGFDTQKGFTLTIA